LDVTVGVIALVALAPILLATAALVRLLLGKPVVVAKECIGYRGRTFNCYAFRAAKNDVRANTWAFHCKGIDDRSCADVLGEVVRAAGLEELPRLLNVVRGDMSLIGPRPIAGSELLRYQIQMPEYFCARPGLTGIWRYVDRRRPQSRWSGLAIDRYYVRYWSVRLDFALLMKAIFAHPTKTNFSLKGER
jgi:exopolysaccharide production protein ExoY